MSNQEDIKKKENDDTIETPDLEKALEEKNLLCEEYLDRLKRTMAEFDNFRKRTQKEKEGIYIDTVADTVSKLLPVLDNLERALESGASDYAGFRQGIDMIFKQFNNVLFDMGVNKIETEEFNPDMHNAVAHITDDSLGENVIVEELQKGYIIKDKVIRCSMVKVAN